MDKSCFATLAAQLRGRLTTHRRAAIWLSMATILVSLIGIPVTAHAKTYFDFRSSTGTAITTQGDGMVCVPDRTNCKYVVINLGQTTSDILGVKYYELNAKNFNIMGGGCTSGALDIAVYNDAAYTIFDHQFGLAGSGASPLPASSSINFSVPAGKFAQLILGCNDGGIPPIATVDGGPGTYQPRDVNSISYSGLPNLCIGDTPADCGAADTTVSYRQTYVNITGKGNGNARFVVNDANGLATHAFWWQQQNGACTPTPQDGEFAFYLGGQLSNYFYVQNCDGVWVGDGQYHWTMYDFSGNSPCGGFRGPCGTFSFGDWITNNFSIQGGGGGSYLDTNGNITPALVLQGDTTPPADPQGLPITISQADTLLIEDDTTGWSAGTDFQPIFSPFTLSPASTLYHAQNSFTISRIHIGSNSDGSSNNHDLIGNVRAWIFNTNGTVIASSTNTCYGEGVCGGRDLVFPPTTLVPQDFILTFITDDGLQADAGWGISHIGIYAEDPHPTLSNLSQFGADGITTIVEGGITFGSAVVFKGTLHSTSSDPLTLQVEVEPLGTQFINIDTMTSSAVTSGQTASLTVTGLNPGQYHWQARAIDLTSFIASPWQEFGSAGNVDFILVPGIREVAATLAKSLVGEPYGYGGKGYDFKLSHYVGQQDIVNGYSYYKADCSGQSKTVTLTIDTGLDCSGLVMWSFNTAFGATSKFLDDNPIQYPGADAQFKYNSSEISESDLSPGDLMFFDFDHDGRMDHVAMYVGGDEVIEASDCGIPIRVSSKSKLELNSGFLACGTDGNGPCFRRVTKPMVGLAIRTHSPISLAVTDPDGVTVDTNTVIFTEREILREVPGVLYYMEDTNNDDTVLVPTPKSGAYLITVAPKPGALPSDTYSVTAEASGSTLPLAENVPIREIPASGYGIQTTGNQISAFIPVTIIVKSSKRRAIINLRSHELIRVAILSNRPFNAVSQVDQRSLTFGHTGTEASLAFCHPGENEEDSPAPLICHFHVNKTGFQVGDTQGVLQGLTLDGQLIRGAAAVRVVKDSDDDDEEDADKRR